MYIFIFISLINPRLTCLYCNLSYGSKKGPAEYFGTQKWGGAIFEITPLEKVGGYSPTPFSAAPTLAGAPVRRKNPTGGDAKPFRRPFSAG